jgi:hypothetical protein
MLHGGEAPVGDMAASPLVIPIGYIAGFRPQYDDAVPDRAKSPPGGKHRRKPHDRSHLRSPMFNPYGASVTFPLTAAPSAAVTR